MKNIHGLYRYISLLILSFLVFSSCITTDEFESNVSEDSVDMYAEEASRTESEVTPSQGATTEVSETEPALLQAITSENTEEGTEEFTPEDLENTDSPEAQVLLSHASIFEGDIDSAEEILASIPSDYENYADVQIAQAFIERLRNNREGEIDILERVISSNPQNVQALIMIGEAELSSNAYAEAQGHFTQALELEPENVSALQGLGNVLFRRNRLRESIETYSQAIEIDPEFSYIYIDRARVYTAQGYYKGAIEDIGTAIDLEPDNGWHYFDRGRLHLLNGTFTLALEDLNRAATYLPDQFLIYTNRAQVLSYLAQYEEALADYDRVMAMRPDYYPAYPYIASLNYIQGNYDRSATYFIQATEDIDPAYILLASLARFAESDFEGRQFLNANIDLLENGSTLYNVGIFYRNSADTRVLNNIRSEENEFDKTRAELYVALRFVQLGMLQTARALMESEEQKSLDGTPESVIKNWLLNVTLQ